VDYTLTGDFVAYDFDDDGIDEFGWYSDGTWSVVEAPVCG